MLKTRDKSRKDSPIKEREIQVRDAIQKDLRARPDEYVEGWKVPKGGE